MKTIVDFTNKIKEKFSMRKDIAPVESSSTASRAYSAGDNFYYGNLLQKATTDIAQGAALVGGTNFENADPVTEQVTSLKETLTNQINKNGSKNILINNAFSQTFLNVPVTVYDDKSMNFNGTSGNTANGLIITDEFLLKAGTYVLSQGNRTSVPPLYLQEGDTVLQDAVIDTSTSSYVVFTTSEDKIVTARFWIGKNLTYNGIVYPMLCLKTDWDLDNSYVAPAMTNRQLTTDKVGMDLLSEVGAVNYYDNKFTDYSDATLTRVINADKSMSVTIPSNLSSSLSAGRDDFTLKAGTYKLSGCPDLCYFDFLNLSNNGSRIGACSSEGLIFTLSATTSVRLVYYLGSTATAGTYIFKTMITPVSYNGPYVPYAKTNRELTEDNETLLDFYNNNKPIDAGDTLSFSRCAGYGIVDANKDVAFYFPLARKVKSPRVCTFVSGTLAQCRGNAQNITDATLVNVVVQRDNSLIIKLHSSSFTPFAVYVVVYEQLNVSVNS